MKHLSIALTLTVGFLYAESPLAFLEKFRLTGPSPVAVTSSVKGDADECAFWVNRNELGASILIGNDKEKPGYIHMWDLSGRPLYRTHRIDRPTGLSVRYDIPLGKGKVDILLSGVRGDNTLHLYAIDGSLPRLDLVTEGGGIQTPLTEIYGACLYKRPRDGKLFAFASNKNQGVILQYAIEDNGTGQFKGRLIREIGHNEHYRRVEGMVADDELGYFYAADERRAIYKYYADPDKGNELLLKFAETDGIKGDREGLALYIEPKGIGYLILSVQGRSAFNFYEREGNNAFVKQVKPRGVAYTDGIAVLSQPVPPHYPRGIFAAHNDTHKNFVLYSIADFLPK